MPKTKKINSKPKPINTSKKIISIRERQGGAR